MKLTRVITAALLAGSVAAPAFAGDDAVLNSYAHTGSKGKIKVTLYGQVNPAMIYVDDGVDSATFFAMNDASSDRLGIKAKGKIDDTWSGGAKIEYQFESTASDKLQMERAIQGASTVFDVRKLEAWLIHKDLGKVSIGLGDMASNGAAESDLSGTKSLGYANVDAHLEDMETINKATGLRVADGLGFFQIEEFIKMDDGHSRQRRVRYDSPSFSGFTLATSVGRHEDATDARKAGGEDELSYDIAARYKGEVEGFKVKAAASYAWNRGGVEDDDLTDVSISIVAPGGVNFTAAWEERDRPGAGVDSDLYYTKLGYQTKALCDWGKTSFAAEYAWSNDFDNTVGRDGKIVGFGVVQKIKALNSEIYGGYRRYSFDDPAIDYHDIDAITTGIKVKL